jgi:hypothetical protein
MSRWHRKYINLFTGNHVNMPWPYSGLDMTSFQVVDMFLGYIPGVQPDSDRSLLYHMRLLSKVIDAVGHFTPYCLHCDNTLVTDTTLSTGGLYIDEYTRTISENKRPQLEAMRLSPRYNRYIEHTRWIRPVLWKVLNVTYRYVRSNCSTDTRILEHYHNVDDQLVDQTGNKVQCTVRVCREIFV